MSNDNAKKDKPATKVTGLPLLREPFAEHQIGKLPKPTKKQTEEIKADYTKGIRCTVCQQWHHPSVVHLDYVGHAAITDRLLDVDPNWKWEPFATDQNGLPQFDNIGGLWINLTILGETKPGYGHPDGKTGGNAIKETIGDALRNAGMRFGMALDLWHKGDLHDNTVSLENQVDTEALKASAKQMADDLKALSEQGDLQGLDGLTKNPEFAETLASLKGSMPKYYDRICVLMNTAKEAIQSRDECPIAAE